MVQPTFTLITAAKFKEEKFPFKNISTQVLMVQKCTHD